jgi:hypothetical protein
MYAFEQDVPIDAAIYGRIIASLGDEPPHGLIAHVAIERPDGHLSYLDLWESKADCDAFTEDRLHPVVGAALRAADIRPDEPPRREVNVIDAWGTDLQRRASLQAGS